MVNPFTQRLLQWLGKLSFPRLFVIAAALFLFDVAIPDFIPFADEILLGLGTLLLARLKRPDAAEPDPRPPIDGEVRR